MIVNLFLAATQTAALAVAAVITGSVSLRTQTVTSLADVAGGLFLLIGMISSVRAANDSHPLGYGRERFFWSFVAAIGIFVGGFGVALAETMRAFIDPQPAGNFLLGYTVLAVVMSLDAVSLATGLQPLRRRAKDRQRSMSALLWKGTDPAVTTVVLSSAAGVASGVIAMCGLLGRELTGQPSPDAVASAAITLVLLATSVVLLHTNRELLTGRGLPPDQLERLVDVVRHQAGIVAVADLFAVVIGPATLIVDADVVFQDALDVPEVEKVVFKTAAALRTALPAVSYVYLNPVGAHRPRGRSPREEPTVSPIR